MNKFDKLKLQLENIIERLEVQIKEKQDRVNYIKLEINNTLNHIIDTRELYDNLIKKKNTLSEVEGKSIIIYLIRRSISECIDKAKELIKEKRYVKVIGWIFALIYILVFCLAIAIVQPEVLIFIFAPVICLALIGVNLDEIVSLRNLKKENTVASLEANLKEIKESLLFNIERKEKCEAESTKLKAEIQSLQAEKSYYEEALKNLIVNKEQVIKEKAVQILNEAFDEEKYSDVMMRLRERTGEN